MSQNEELTHLYSLYALVKEINSRLRHAGQVNTVGENSYSFQVVKLPLLGQTTHFGLQLTEGRTQSF
jgi:hypothetical protein